MASRLPENSRYISSDTSILLNTVKIAHNKTPETSALRPFPARGGRPGWGETVLYRINIDLATGKSTSAEAHTPAPTHPRLRGWEQVAVESRLDA